MSFALIGLVVVLIMFSLGLGRALGAQGLVDEMETACKDSVSDIKEIFEEQWLKHGVPFIKRLVLSMVAVSVLAIVASIVLAVETPVSSTLPMITGGIALTSAGWLFYHWQMNRGKFSASSALSAMIASVAAMGAGIYLYGQFTADVVTSLVGYLVVVVATEAVFAVVVVLAKLAALAVQMSEGAGNIGLQFVHEILSGIHAGLQKIVDVQIGSEEKYVPKTVAWCGKVRLARDAVLLLGILYPSPVTLVLGTIAALVTNVGVRVYNEADSPEEATKRQKSAAKTYNFVIAVLFPLVVLRFLPFLLAALPKEWMEQFTGLSGVLAAVKDVLGHPTAYIAVAILAASFFIPKRSAEVKPRAYVLGTITVFASFVLFIAYWVMWGSAVFYVLPVVLVVCWLVSRSSLRGAGMVLGGGYLAALLIMSLVRNDHVAKEQAEFDALTGKAAQAAKVVAATATAPATVAPPAKQVQASKPARVSHKSDDADDSTALSPAWVEYCRYHPTLSSCKH